MVLGVHVSRSTLAPGSTAPGALAAHLDRGVDIFFVLSGFLIYRPFLVRAGLAVPDRNQFWRNRVLRIVPAYWAALTVYAILGLTTTATVGQRILNYGFLQVYQPHSVILIAPSWTLCSEAAFYFLLPFYGSRAFERWGALARGRARSELRSLACAFLALTVLHVLITDIGSRVRSVVGRIDWTLVGTLDMFVVGMMLAVVAADPELRERARSWCPRLEIGWASAAALYVSVSLLTAPYDFMQWTVLDRAWTMTIALLLIAPIVLQKGRGPHGLTGAAFTQIGIASYGLYIWHVPFVEWLTGQHLGIAAFKVVSISGSIAIGLASYYIVERPFLRRHRSQQISVADPTVIPAAQSAEIAEAAEPE
jgi:peptidoglycan/LPS O-acetylase OafA/YrhL